MLIKASLSNKSEQKTKQLELKRWLAIYTRPLFEASYVFTAAVILYQEQWKRVISIES